jgi:hypothetical protein
MHKGRALQRLLAILINPTGLSFGSDLYRDFIYGAKIN